MYIKKHESPRNLGVRNKKGSSTPKLVKRKKKQIKQLRKKLKD